MSDDQKPMDHDYDGIQEFDNPLPMWWLITFFGTIIFGYIYWLNDMSGAAPTQIQELRQDLADLKKNAPQMSPEEDAAAMVALTHSPEAILEGKAVFVAKCVACHGQNGEGGIGPNLTDKYWLHGNGEVVDIAHTIRKGVLDKGMPNWETQLSTKEVQSVAAYVVTLKGTNPANAKAPQGQLVDGTATQ